MQEKSYRNNYFQIKAFFFANSLCGSRLQVVSNFGKKKKKREHVKYMSCARLGGHLAYTSVLLNVCLVPSESCMAGLSHPFSYFWTTC